MADSSLGRIAPAASQSKVWGILIRKERWHLSWRGWLLTVGLIIAICLLAGLNAYPFLAVNRPLQTDILVVEGWVHSYAIRTAAERFRSEDYRLVYVTGGPVAGSGGYINDFNTYASVGAEQLIAAGIPPSQVKVVASRESGRDRTYSSAVVLRRALQDQGLKVPALNVMTENAHARRTLLLFQKALGSEIKVGVIPIANPDYDPTRWWRYSEGVREVIGESLAYLYARIVFSPKEADGVPPASGRP